MSDDPTRVIDPAAGDWLPIAAAPGSDIKVLAVDRERRQVVFAFRFAPGTELPPHTHHCQAIAYTASGAWSYEGLDLPTGTIAYEPPGSTHAPSSADGAELLVILTSDSDRFLDNHMPDGTTLSFDLDFFAALAQAPLD